MCGTAVTAIVAVLMVCASIQTSYWRNSQSLWNHTLACTSQNYIAHYNLGVALAKRGNLDEAIEHFHQAVRIDPEHAKAHINLGIALKMQGKLAEAIEHYQRALRIKPDYVKAHKNMGTALQAQGNLVEAVERYRQALQIEPDHTEILNKLGNALRALGQLSEALKHFQRVLQIDPNNARAHYQVGTTLAALGRFQEALAHYDDAVRRSPQNALALNNLAWLLATCPLAEVRDAKRALQLAERLAKLQRPGRFTFLDTLAAAHAEAGQFDEAVRWQEKAIQLAPAEQQDELRGRLEMYRQGKPFRETHTKPAAIKLDGPASSIHGPKQDE